MFVLLVSCNGSAAAGCAAFHSVCRGAPSAHLESASAAIRCTCTVAYGRMSLHHHVGVQGMLFYCVAHSAALQDLWQPLQSLNKNPSPMSMPMLTAGLLHRSASPRPLPAPPTGWRPRGASCQSSEAQIAAPPPAAAPPVRIRVCLSRVVHHSCRSALVHLGHLHTHACSACQTQSCLSMQQSPGRVPALGLSRSRLEQGPYLLVALAAVARRAARPPPATGAGRSPHLARGDPCPAPAHACNHITRSHPNGGTL